MAVLVGNAYTLDIPQVTTHKADAPVKPLAAPERAQDPLTGRSGPSAAVAGGPAGAWSAQPIGGKLLPAVHWSSQGVEEAAQAPADDTLDADNGDAVPGVLTPATPSAIGFASDTGGPLGFGAAGSGGFGPPSGGGGFLSAPSGGGGPSTGASPQATAPPQGLQPLVSAPVLTGPAPEPATWELLILGLAGIGAALRQRHSRRLSRSRPWRPVPASPSSPAGWAAAWACG